MQDLIKEIVEQSTGYKVLPDEIVVNKKPTCESVGQLTDFLCKGMYVRYTYKWEV